MRTLSFYETVLWAQSSQAVWNRLEALNNYETMKQDSNGLELLIAIKDVRELGLAMCFPIFEW